MIEVNDHKTEDEISCEAPSLCVSRSLGIAGRTSGDLQFDESLAKRSPSQERAIMAMQRQLM
ncbi:MAG: hypothetical protein LBU32_23115 [Clostridiales bacterium]|nr:hypothetical protein [Clostridiales bacterium]